VYTICTNYLCKIRAVVDDETRLVLCTQLAHLEGYLVELAQAALFGSELNEDAVRRRAM
jgi:hypothetical protein